MGMPIEASPSSSSVERPAPLGASVRRARERDLPALARLVNRAYQVEAFFVEGDRTGQGELATMADRGHFLVLDGAPGELAASVYVRVDGGRGFLAMLAVAPELQRRGLGHRLVAVVEALCAALGCGVVALDIVNLREDLEPFYRRLGYQPVGTAPYDHRMPRVPCHFVRMEKQLPGPA
jgi:GNAT superfamily N-acetyltransferase